MGQNAIWSDANQKRHQNTQETTFDDRFWILKRIGYIM